VSVKFNLIFYTDEKDLGYIYSGDVYGILLSDSWISDILLFPGTWRRISTWTDLAPGTGQP
jgi:hypothetical protein